MKFNRLLYEDMPLAHITITWVIANIVLSIIHSPKVAMNIILQMSYLFGIISFLVCLIISNKIFQLLEKIKKLRVNFNQKVTLSEYDTYVKRNTKVQVQKLTKSAEYKEYLEKKKTFPKDVNPEVIMRSSETASKIADDIFELKKLQEVLFQDG